MSASRETTRSGPTRHGRRGADTAVPKESARDARARVRARGPGGEASDVIAEHHLAWMGLEIELPPDVVDLV